MKTSLYKLTKDNLEQDLVQRGNLVVDDEKHYTYEDLLINIDIVFHLVQRFKITDYINLVKYFDRVVKGWLIYLDSLYQINDEYIFIDLTDYYDVIKKVI